MMIPPSISRRTSFDWEDLPKLYQGGPQALHLIARAPKKGGQVRLCDLGIQCKQDFLTQRKTVEIK
eukprot:7367539-Prorocentrum_lima.AAC.1